MDADAVSVRTASAVALPGPAPLTLDLIAGWLLEQTSDNTRKAYGRDLGRFARYLAGHQVDLLDATRPQAAAWAESMRRELKPDGSRRIGETTIARRLSAVSSFYTYAVDQDARPANPVKTMKRPQPVGQDEDRVAWLDTTQSKAYLAAARAHSPRAYALAAVMLTTGCRTTEALAADVSDLSWRGGHRVVTVTRKGGKRQALPLAPWVGEAVDAYLGDRADGPLFATVARAGGHGRLDEPALWRLVKRLATKAGLPAPLVADLHPHSLRHSAITGALEAGGSLRDVQAMAGHADARTTERYDRMRGRLDKSPVYALAAALVD